MGPDDESDIQYAEGRNNCNYNTTYNKGSPDQKKNCSTEYGNFQPNGRSSVNNADTFSLNANENGEVTYKVHLRYCSLIKKINFLGKDLTVHRNEHYLIYQIISFECEKLRTKG